MDLNPSRAEIEIVG